MTWGASKRRVSGSRRWRSHAIPRNRIVNEVDEAPAARAEVGKGQDHDAQSGAEPAGERHDADGVGARALGHLLRGDDADEQQQGDADRAAERLRHRQPRQRRCERAEAAQHRRRHGRDDEHPAATLPIGQEHEADGEHDAASHDRARDALGRVRRAELVGGERDGLGEQGVHVAVDDRRRGEQAQHRGGAAVEAVGRRPPRLEAVAPRCRWSLQRRPDGHEEEPGEPGDGEAERGRLDDVIAVIVERALVLAKRALRRTKRPRRRRPPRARCRRAGRGARRGRRRQGGPVRPESARWPGSSPCSGHTGSPWIASSCGPEGPCPGPSGSVEPRTPCSS